MKLRGLAAAVLLALVLGACGGGSGDEGAVREVVEDLYAGLADKDADKICGFLTRSQRRAVASGGGARSGASCEQVMGVALTYVVGDGLEDADQAKVTKVTVKGSRATATVDFKGTPGELGLAKEDGDWRVSDFNLKKL
jgi:hypothetical protein